MNSEELIFENSKVDFRVANQRLLRMGCTDGLPIVPATSETVDYWMESCEITNPHQVLTVMPPSMQTVTPYAIAVNAIMAGCEPSHLPVLTAAVQAVCEEDFNLLGIQTTTGSATPAVLVNGPIRQDLEINSKGNCLGPGFRANAGIGRALGLVLLNVGGAKPGTVDMATIGQPGKFTFCFAENEEESPWPAFHVTRGYSATEDIVTVFGASGTLEVLDAGASRAEDALTTMAHSALLTGNLGMEGGIGGGEVFFLIPPEVANLLARDGYTRQKAQMFIYENAQIPMTFFSTSGQACIAAFRKREGLDLQTPVCIAKDPDSVFFVVSGGVGLKCCLIPTWNGGTRAISKRVGDLVDRKD